MEIKVSILKVKINKRNRNDSESINKFIKENCYIIVQYIRSFVFLTSEAILDILQ